MKSLEDEFWEALVIHQAVKEVCIPFACMVFGAISFQFGLSVGIPVAVFVYWIFMLKANNRLRSAEMAYKDAEREYFS